MKHLFAYSLIILFLVPTSVAQTMKELEKQRKQAQNNLRVTTQLLKETSKEKQSSVNTIKLLNQNIKDRQLVITTINAELNAIDLTMDTLRSERDNLTAKLQRQKAEYARLTQQTHYRRGALNYLAFILSAENFNQMFRRLRYLQQFSSYRKQKIREIEETTQQLVIKEETLQQTRDTKNEVLLVKQTESRKLESAKDRESKMLEDLKKKEKNLLAQQKKQQKLADDLNRKIQQMIDAEIAKEKKKSGAKTEKGNKIVMTKEETLIAGNFEKNKGRLPWPVEKGFISGHFGIQQHPVLEHVTMNNKGVYIQTNAGADARAVFEGVVTQCFSIPGNNNAVIIKHGNYRTVYTNLTTLYVKEGDKVTAKQKVGKIFVDTENNNKTEMLLMLYLDTTLKDPESWLAK